MGARVTDSRSGTINGRVQLEYPKSLLFHTKIIRKLQELDPVQTWVVEPAAGAVLLTPLP